MSAGPAARNLPLLDRERHLRFSRQLAGHVSGPDRQRVGSRREAGERELDEAGLQILSRPRVDDRDRYVRIDAARRIRRREGELRLRGGQRAAHRGVDPPRPRRKRAGPGGVLRRIVSEQGRQGRFRGRADLAASRLLLEQQGRVEPQRRGRRFGHDDGSRSPRAPPGLRVLDDDAARIPARIEGHREHRVEGPVTRRGGLDPEALDGRLSLVVVVKEKIGFGPRPDDGLRQRVRHAGEGDDVRPAADHDRHRAHRHLGRELGQGIVAEGQVRHLEELFEPRIFRERLGIVVAVLAEHLAPGPGDLDLDLVEGPVPGGRHGVAEDVEGAGHVLDLGQGVLVIHRVAEISAPGLARKLEEGVLAGDLPRTHGRSVGIVDVRFPERSRAVDGVDRRVRGLELLERFRELAPHARVRLGVVVGVQLGHHLVGVARVHVRDVQPLSLAGDQGPADARREQDHVLPAGDVAQGPGQVGEGLGELPGLVDVALPAALVDDACRLGLGQVLVEFFHARLLGQVGRVHEPELVGVEEVRQALGPADDRSEAERVDDAADLGVVLGQVLVDGQAPRGRVRQDPDLVAGPDRRVDEGEGGFPALRALRGSVKAKSKRKRNFRPSRDASTGPAGARSSPPRTWFSKWVTVTGLPLSVTWKSAAVRSVTGLPSLAVT
ncbi:MAG: hypothetical protein MZV63_66055 [Marinilabiliales bacterium]|nr:hypothetical protein [Marinilabiliales bacterium]